MNVCHNQGLMKLLKVKRACNYSNLANIKSKPKIIEILELYACI